MGKFNLPDKTGRILEDFIERLKAIYGAELVSVILYGSAASGEYAGGNSNVNVAVILSDASLAGIARASGVVNKRKFRLIRPVFFPQEHIERSADVFPVEFLDMKENHILLHGSDPLKDLKVDEKNLRFQCEQELKSKIINMKTAYLARMSAARRKTILFRFFTSSLHILRNILRLKGGEAVYLKKDVIGNIGAQFGIDVSVFKKILDAKNGDLRLTPRETEKLFFGFTSELEKIADAVDRL